MDSDAASGPQITDPFLLSLLDTSSNARSIALEVLSLLTTSAASSTTAPAASTTTTTAPSSTLATSQAQLRSHLSTLRLQNRKLANYIRSTKSETAQSRSEIDALHLSLQNLHYESRHLEGEIQACEDFPHTYTSLPLVAEEAFLERQPEWADKSEDEVMKARIQAEYEERVALEEERKKLMGRKVELVRQNAKRKEELGRLDRDLERFVAAAEPILKTFEKDY